STKWTKKLQDEQVEPLSPGRCGVAALNIVTKDADSGDDCPDDEVCQRAELQVDRSAWPPYGNETWYAFSFHIKASGFPIGNSDRTVIGQWKAPADDSPFVAQRFDDEVFQITVQDKDTRRLVASSEGDPAKIAQAQNLLSTINPKDVNVV